MGRDTAPGSKKDSECYFTQKIYIFFDEMSR